MAISPQFRRTLTIIIGIMTSVFFIAISIGHMDWRQVYKALSNAHLYPWVLIGVVSYLVGHLCRGLRTRLLVSRDARLTTFTASNIVVVGYAVNNIIPARVGELARAGMLTERTGISFAQSVTVVVLERIFDGMAIVLLMLLSIFMLGAGINAHMTMLLPFSISVAICLACLLFVAFAPHRFMATVARVVYAVNPRLHDASLRIMTSIVNGVAYAGSPGALLRIIGLSIIIWLCDAGLFLCMMPAFDIPLNVWHAFFVMAAANIGIFIFASPGYSSPGHIGPFHALVMQGLMALGCEQSTAIAFAMAVHCAIYIPIMLWGGAVILWYGVSLGLTRKLAQKARIISGMPEQLSLAANRLGTTFADTINERASVFIYKLTEAVLPLDSFKLTNQEEAVSYAADFIQGEVRSLSKKIQVLFSIGMFGFGVLVWLRFFRPFSQLPLSCRVRIFNDWAYGKIPVTRQLFKLVRSTALLAFFEYPSVIKALEENTMHHER